MVIMASGIARGRVRTRAATTTTVSRNMAAIGGHALTAFSSPEAALLLVGTKNRYLWPGVRFSKDPKTSRARKPSRKAPETTFVCFTKKSTRKILSPKTTSFSPVNFTGTHYLPKSVFGSVFLLLA